ncbi:MAG: hypothetical protein NZ699_18145 [Roseiflexus sp.]|nr:hypothetical protein [Roseiflexus sp.]MCS7291047.1 hypothetical protein [Roseiflexus sp.]MDW8146765.1 hypothetical protein [Roseiflexaceae bacterium]MDW8234488.1 hypothetical protein [Roseiflexaceae bacterium]
MTDTLVGLVTPGIDLVERIAGDAKTRRTHGALLEALATDPLGALGSVLWSVVEPIVSDW